MGRRNWEEAIETIACEPQLRVIEHLAHHATWLLRRARATLEAVQSLACDHSLPWAVEGAVRELDPDEIGAIKNAFDELIEAICEARHRADVATDGEPESDEFEGDEIVVDVEPHVDEAKPSPCAS